MSKYIDGTSEYERSMQCDSMAYQPRSTNESVTLQAWLFVLASLLGSYSTVLLPTETNANTFQLTTWTAFMVILRKDLKLS